MYRRATSTTLCAALLLVLMAIPASASRVQRIVDGGGGVIDPGQALVLFEFHLDGDHLHLDMDVWFGVEDESEIHDPEIPSICHYSGDTDTNPELGYVDQGRSFLVTIDGPADLGCNDGGYVLAELGVRPSFGGFLTEPITDGDGSLCRGVRHTTGNSGIARAHLEAQGLEPEVVIDGEGTPGSGFFGSEQWLCLEPGA